MLKAKSKKQSFLLLCVLLFLMSSVAFARSDVDSVVNVGEGQNVLTGICSRANQVADGREILVYTSGDGLLSFSNKEYVELDMDTKREFMETALKLTKESGMGTQLKNKVYNFIEQQDETTSAAVKYLKSDASADFVAARSWFRPFGSAIGIVMGVMCLLIFVFLAASVAFDLCYMLIPGVQAILEGGEENKKPFGVSREAYKTVREVESSAEYKSVLSIYLKRRVGIVLLCALCLAYIISGQIYDILVFLIDAFSQF